MTLEAWSIAADIPPRAAAPPPWAVAFSIGLFVVAVTVPLIVLNVLGSKRARRLLDEWARVNGLELDDATEIGFARGPFRMRPRWTTVFRIKTRANERTASRTAWVCMNNVFVWGSSPDVRWDE